MFLLLLKVGWGAGAAQNPIFLVSLLIFQLFFFNTPK